jgi:hypothetical protein
VDRFWSKIAKRGTDECWEWQGCRTVGDAKRTGGYGQLTMRRKGRIAHRVAWELANEASILPGYCVCHRCDNPPCCNPAHLFLGTKRDNSRDRDAKGRNGVHTRPERVPRGDAHWMSKLGDWQIPYIFALASAGVVHKDIAAAYGVGRTAITRILNGTRRKGL